MDIIPNGWRHFWLILFFGLTYVPLVLFLGIAGDALFGRLVPSSSYVAFALLPSVTYLVRATKTFIQHLKASGQPVAIPILIQFVLTLSIPMIAIIALMSWLVFAFFAAARGSWA